MRKERLINVVCRKKNGDLEYIIIEHSSIGPADFLRFLIDKHALGLLWLGHDGPNTLSAKESQILIDGIVKEDIKAELRSGFIWVNHNEFYKLYKQRWFTLEGDAIILKSKPPEEEIKCEKLPQPSGFNKDKISSEDRSILGALLSNDDVYIYDDFTDSLIVSKNKSVLNTILEQIERLKA